MKKVKANTRFKRFIKDISVHTPFTTMLLLLIVLWLIFSAGIYFAEQNVEGAHINSYGDALYWGVAALEYNLEQLNDLSLDELDLLRETVDTLIIHVEGIKEKQQKRK